MRNAHRLQGLREGFDDLNSESEEASLGELSSMDQHPADVGTETFNRERDLSILENVEAELADVDHAIPAASTTAPTAPCEVLRQTIEDARLEPCRPPASASTTRPWPSGKPASSSAQRTTGGRRRSHHRRRCAVLLRDADRRHRLERQARVWRLTARRSAHIRRPAVRGRTAPMPSA